MNATARNVLAVVVGAAVTLAVNGGIGSASPHLVPPPEGVDPNNLDSIKAGIHLYQPKHFLMAWLAHGLGSFAGAFAASLLAASHRTPIALGIGTLHLLAGIAACFLIPAPAWFMAADLLGAYLPMAWLGAKAAEQVRPSSTMSPAAAPTP